MKRLILVTSPPASGKTYVSKQLAKQLRHVVYLDKDTLIVLSKQIFAVAGQETIAALTSLKKTYGTMSMTLLWRLP
jgi:tRNA uridine 5-carbamoylmethylation protein Kti12